MKKIIRVIPAFLLAVTCFSCGSAGSSSKVNETKGKIIESSVDAFESVPDRGNLGGKDEAFLRAVLTGSDRVIDYNEIIQSEEFEKEYSFIASSSDPLHIRKEGDNNIYVAKPFLIAAATDKGDIYPINVWQFPVMNDNKVVAFIFADCRLRDRTNVEISSGNGYCEGLNQATDKASGTFAVFSTSEHDYPTYAVYEDDSVFNMFDGTEYSGNMTYELAVQEYNTISPETLKERVYPL